MKRLRFALFAILMILLFSACQPLLVAPPESEMETGADGDAVDAYLTAYDAVEPAPLLTASEPDLTYDEAYGFQEELAAAWRAQGNEQIGYKLGLTGEQRPFGAEEPLYGRLFDFMLLENGATVPSSDFVQPMVELEIAYYFDEDVTYPITVEALQAAVGQVAPAIELPDLLFADMKNLSWLDLIATGVAPRRLIIGAPVAEEEFDENAVTVAITRGDEVVSEGVGAAVMGDQWAALEFLAEKLNDRGAQIHAGDVVITGATNAMFPAAPGSYEADYGPFGMITFEVAE